MANDSVSTSDLLSYVWMVLAKKLYRMTMTFDTTTMLANLVTKLIVTA